MDGTHSDSLRAGQIVDRRDWVDGMAARGMRCKFDPGYTGSAVAPRSGQAGQVHIVDGELSWQSLSPIKGHPSLWDCGHLYLVIVRGGTMTMEQNRETRTFLPGEMVLFDPSRDFRQSFREATRIAALKFPRDALRERGLRYSFRDLRSPDQMSADVNAMRDIVLHTVAQTGTVSRSMLIRLSEQCLDLMDLVVDERSASSSGRTTAATLLRIKQVITRLIGDPTLSTTRIATALNMSESGLTRALKPSGLSPMRYAWSLRLECAARLLEGNSQRSVQEIAYRCGFASAAHFSRVFKQHYGVTPREFSMRHVANA